MLPTQQQYSYPYASPDEKINDYHQFHYLPLFAFQLIHFSYKKEIIDALLIAKFDYFELSEVWCNQADLIGEIEELFEWIFELDFDDREMLRQMRRYF